MSKLQVLDLQGLEELAKHIPRITPGDNITITTPDETKPNQILISSTANGGTLMWVGTAADLQEALDKGEIKDGTIINVTDDVPDLQSINYNALINRPKIEGVLLSGDVSVGDLNVYTKTEIDSKIGDVGTKLETEIEEVIKSIPTPNNATLTIKQNGEVKGTFTANSDEDIIVDLTGGGGGYYVNWENITDKPSTLAGFGIADAKINNGRIILGANEITPALKSETYTKDETFNKTEVENLIENSLGSIELALVEL